MIMINEKEEERERERITWNESYSVLYDEWMKATKQQQTKKKQLHSLLNIAI